MPWSNQSGSTGGNGQGPWSGPPGGRTGFYPQFEDLLRRGWIRLRKRMPQGRRRAAGLTAIGFGLVVLWLLSGVYFVSSHEQGIVLRFGRVVGQSALGINYHLPWPIETAKVVEMTNVNQLDIGFVRSSEVSDPTQAGDVPAESLMLTGDENIVDVNFTVFWVVKDAGAYLFNVDNPDKAIKAVAESAMREVIGQTSSESINPNRDRVQSRVRALMQRTLDLYGAGVAITDVKLGNASAPAMVDDAFRDVQAALADREKARNDAESYASRIIPEARGEAARMVQAAEAYRQKAIAEASGEGERFLSVYREYKKAPEVTRRRIYLETMSQVLAPMNKIILDNEASRNLAPYLPLPDLQKNRTETVTVTPGPQPQVTAGPQQ